MSQYIPAYLGEDVQLIDGQVESSQPDERLMLRRNAMYLMGKHPDWGKQQIKAALNGKEIKEQPQEKSFAQVNRSQVNREKEYEFDPNQDRDEKGRRTSEGEGRAESKLEAVHLTGAAKAIVEDFQDIGYHEINGYLREGPIGYAPEKIQRAVIHLDRVFSSKGITLKNDLIVYRGVDLADMPKDSSFQERGYQSTSLNPESAGFFGDTVFKLRIPAGTKVLPLLQGKEQEVLLPRGLQIDLGQRISIAAGSRGNQILSGKVYTQTDSPELNRSLTSYERKVDFKVLDSETKKLASQGTDRVKQLLAESRDKLMALITSRHKAGSLSAKFVLDLELRGLGQLIPTLREVLGASFRLGQREAGKELKKTFVQYASDWSEEDHPREDDGKFAPKGDGESKEGGIPKKEIGGKFGSVPPGISSDRQAKRAFLASLRRADASGGVFISHETDMKNLSSIEQHGLEEGNFGTLGEASHFLIGDRARVWIRVPKESLETLTPDMRYDPDRPYMDLVKQHPKLRGADLSLNDPIPKEWITHIEIVNSDNSIKEVIQKNKKIYYRLDIAKLSHSYQVKLDPTGLPPEKALEFFERKAILWGADIRQPLLSEVKNILFDGIKQGTPLRDLMQRIGEAYLPWLGDPDQAVDELMLTPYRLETLVRTNVIEALNEGRKAQFQDAVDDGFVIGLQYSAILDARTTEVCRHLDEKVFPANSPDLDRLTPPRHFSCRSVLVPITRMEGPVQYITQSQVAKGIELSGKGFREDGESREYTSDFDESEHPREDDGKFAPKGSGESSSNAKSEDAIRAVGIGKERIFVNADGSPVDEATQARIDALGIPPAWTGVQVSADPQSPLQAIGYDASGKEQPRYSKEHTTAANAAKHLRVAALAQGGYKKMVKGVEMDLQNGREEAVVMSLVLSTAMRIGGDSEKAVGATTLEAQHLSVDGDMVRFDFPGKSGKRWEGTIRNEQLAEQINIRLQGKSGTDRVFSTSAGKVNSYLKQYGKMSAKDVRTLQGTSVAIKELKRLGEPKTVKEAKQQIKMITTKVAEHLRNTPTVAKKSYINPAVWAPIQAKFGIQVAA